MQHAVVPLPQLRGGAARAPLADERANDAYAGAGQPGDGEPCERGADPRGGSRHRQQG